MNKNVCVVDEFGTKYGATYPKRAKGLVKKGRARYVDENTICLACPAKINSEEMMENNNIEKFFANSQEFIDKQTQAGTVTVKDILDRVDDLRKESATLNYALQDFVNNLNIPSDIEDTELASALAELYNGIEGAFVQRDFTYRELLKFYQNLYTDLFYGKETNQ